MRFLWVFLIAIGAPVIFNFAYLSWSTPYTHGTTEQWMGFFGNYIGGIIGGYVAYLIMRFQISDQDRKEKIRQKENQLTSLLRLKKEVEIVYKGARSLEYLALAREKDESYLRPEEPPEVSFPLENINDRLWNDSMDAIIDKDLRMQLLEIKSFYHALYTEFTTNNLILTTELEYEKKKIELLKSKYETLTMEHRLILLQAESRMDTLDLNIRQRKLSRKLHWDKLLKIKYFEQVDAVYKKIDQLITNYSEKSTP